MVGIILICLRDRNKIDMVGVEWVRGSKVRYVGKSEVMWGFIS